MGFYLQFTSKILFVNIDWDEVISVVCGFLLEILPSFFILARNIGFMVKNIPAAGKKAEEHFKRAIEVAKEIGANSWMAMAYLDLGLLHKAKKRNDQARKCISEAIELFEQCEAEVYLQQAKEALASLGGIEG